MREVSYQELRKEFQDWEEKRRESKDMKPKQAKLIFTEDSFKSHFTEAERTYAISSDSKAYQHWMGGYSLFGVCTEDNDMVRLEQYMVDECGAYGTWKLEKCYIVE